MPPRDDPGTRARTTSTPGYTARGQTMLTGLEDAVRLYEVRWRG